MSSNTEASDDRESSCHPLRHVLKGLEKPDNLSREELADIIGYIHLECLNLKVFGGRMFGGDDADRLSREAMHIIRRIVAKRRYVPFTDGALSFVASYPRSGNTLTTASISKLGAVQIFSDLAGAPNYIPLECFPSVYPFTRIVKSHKVPPYTEANKYIFIVRDGRDVLPSHAYMTRQQRKHDFSRKSELKDFIHWQSEHYDFGSWSAWSREMLRLRHMENVLIVRYEDLIESLDEFWRIVSFLGIPIDRETIQAAYASRGDIVERLESDDNANHRWGFGVSDFPEDSLFYEWSRNRGGSTWRDTMDESARLAFHETGATNCLIELGYESDPEWYRC